MFAAEDWYNSQQPFSESVCLYTGTGTNYYAVYGQDGVTFNNPKTPSSKFVSLLFAEPEYESGWDLVVSEAYDYYITAIVQAPGEPTDFTYYPTGLSVEYATHNDVLKIRVEEQKITHYEGRNTTGFYGTGKIPETIYFGNQLRAVWFDGLTAGTVGANVSAFIYVWQVPKADSSAADGSAAIVQALQDQTAALMSKMDSQTSAITGAIDDATDRLMNSDGVRPFLGAVVDDSKQVVEGILDIDPSDRLTDNLLPQLTNEKMQVSFPGLRGPFLPDGQWVTILEPQIVDLSYMSRFSELTDATGVFMVISCAWLSIKFLHKKLMLILGDPEAVKE